jgi:hypothetical protein
MTDRELLELALKALESGLAFSTQSPVLQNLRAQLEQPEQRKPLTGEQIEFAWMKAMQSTPGTTLPIHEFARAIEAAHGIGETP